MKLTRHNGRAGKNGVYNPKHNDRSFDIANSEHIDEERAKQNLYWDCYNGFRNFKNPEKENELSATFEDVEQLFYRQRYHDFVTGQNERNVKNRHPERNKETGDLLKSKKTCPEETVYQIGTLDNHVPPELLIEIVTEFMEIANERFGSHVHILNWALHLDESTPHIHERHVFDCENKHGEVAPQQEKALEALGFELPDPDKPLSCRNNRKITFDAACRKMLFEIAKRHGLELEEEAEYGNRKYLEKQDFILAKQKEQLAAQQNRLDELTLKVSDMETLLEDVSAVAYDKAVRKIVVTVSDEAADGSKTGYLSAKVSYEGDANLPPVFTNSYAEEPGTPGTPENPGTPGGGSGGGSDNGSGSGSSGDGSKGGMPDTGDRSLPVEALAVMAGIGALTLSEGDELIAVMKTDGKQDIMLASADGMAICFNENDVRVMGRDAAGVRGMALDAGDSIVGAGIAAKGRQLLSVTEYGYGKRTDIEEYMRLGDDGVRRPQQRGGKGLKNYNITAKTGRIAGVAIVDDEDDVMLIENGGVLIRMAAADINVYKRDTPVSYTHLTLPTKRIV